MWGTKELLGSLMSKPLIHGIMHIYTHTFLKSNELWSSRFQFNSIFRLFWIYVSIERSFYFVMTLVVILTEIMLTDRLSNTMSVQVSLLNVSTRWRCFPCSSWSCRLYLQMLSFLSPAQNLSGLQSAVCPLCYKSGEYLSVRTGHRSGQRCPEDLTDPSGSAFLVCAVTSDNFTSLLGSQQRKTGSNRSSLLGYLVFNRHPTMTLKLTCNLPSSSTNISWVQTTNDIWHVLAETYLMSLFLPFRHACRQKRLRLLCICMKKSRAKTRVAFFDEEYVEQSKC